MIRQLREVVMGRVCLRLLVLFGILIASMPVFAIASAATFPTGLSFTPQKSGTVSGPQAFTVDNVGTTDITVTGVTASVTQFVVSGTFPVTILPAKWQSFTVTFNPSTAKAYVGTLTVAITGLPGEKATVNGTGTSSTGIARLSQKYLTFASQTLGTNASQPLNITNTGTTSFKDTCVT